MSPIALAWREALADVIIRSPYTDASVTLAVRSWGRPPYDVPPNLLAPEYDEPIAGYLTIEVDRVDSLTGTTRFQNTLHVALSFFPGIGWARRWVAVAWAGHAIHEALEQVTVGDLATRPIDPHRLAVDRRRSVLMPGVPLLLTATSMRAAFVAVLGEKITAALIAKHGAIA